MRAFFYRPLLSRAHILVRVPRGTLGCVPVSYVRSALFVRSIRDFRPGSGLICCVRKVKRKNPVSFTPNPVNHNCLLHPCEGWRRKTKNSWRARMRVGLGQRFFTGKQIAAVRRIIYSTNWEERLNHSYSYLVLARSDALPASVVCLLCAVTRNVRLGWVDDPVKRQRKLTSQIALRLVVYQAWGAYVVLVAWLYAFMSH